MQRSFELCGLNVRRRDHIIRDSERVPEGVMLPKALDPSSGLATELMAPYMFNCGRILQDTLDFQLLMYTGPWHSTSICLLST